MSTSVYTELARRAVETYLRDGKKISAPQNFSRLLEKKGRAGVFVTIENGQTKQLRGCIGTYLPTQPTLAAEIINNAIAAATEDYRFQPIALAELPHLRFTVSLLAEPQQVKTLKDLDVKKYGVIVKTADGRSGLLLPDIDSVDTAEKQVAIAAQKGNIDLITDSIYLFRFTVKKFAE